MHPRNVKAKITLSITSDQIVRIRAPLETSFPLIQQTLNHHAEWILSHLSRQPTAFHYIQHENHPYLGKNFPLYIQETPTAPQNITLSHDRFLISVKRNTPLRIYKLLNHWYQLQAFQFFTQRFQHFQNHIPWINWENACPTLKIRKMTSQWGSYNRKGNGIITLNFHLIKARPEAIDYVILHELCHAVEFNHGKRFYALLASHMPEWKTWKTYLRENSFLLSQDQEPC